MIKRPAILYLWIVLLPFNLMAQLSKNASISLMTVAPGEEVYSIFGHSALRVQDPDLMLDRCYNYGTFEFDQPNFLLKFCRGKLLYYLNIEPTRAFKNANLYDRRAMQEQVLQLDSMQRQRLFELLEENALPANRYYKYDFFYDNCATRIRDIVKESFYHQIYFDSTGLQKGKTMRQLLKPYLKQHPWTDFGIDLVLGLPADRRAAAENWMFLPDHLHDFFARTSIQDSIRLVAAEQTIPEHGFATIPAPKKRDWVEQFFASPLLMMCFVALLGLLSMANPRTERIFDSIFWLMLGIAGTVMFLLWVATDHSATKTNLNVLWALPTHLFFFWRSRRASELTDNYFIGTAILAALVLLFWNFLPQAMPVAATPLVILVVVKGLWGRLRRRENV